MNIMNTLTLKHIKKNKARTIVTIIGIIISVAMLTAVTTGITSGMRWFRNGEIEESGKWHAEFDQLPLAKWKQLKGMDGFEEVFATKEVGYALARQSRDKSKPYVFVRAYDSNALQNMPIKLLEGRLPANSDEIILSKELSGGGIDTLKLGDAVSYQFGERYLKDTNNEEALSSYGVEREKPLTQKCKYLNKSSTIYIPGEESIHEITASEEFRPNSQKKTYTVVGFIQQRNSAEEPFDAAGCSAYTYLDEKSIAADGTVNGYCYYENVSRKIYDDMKLTAKVLGVGQPSRVNDHVLYYEGVTPDNRFTDYIALMYLFLITIIVIGSVSLIYNSFAISISERSKQLGMLASVGATKRQKRNCVFFEALLYGVIGIPLGIASGLLGITIAFKVVSDLILHTFEITSPLVTVVLGKNILTSAVLAIVTIFISAYIPARRASKISAIEAIRQNKDIRIKVKKVRVLWITKKIFGFEGELATKNMKRNRRRYRSIIFSLLISVVLFITVSAYLHYVTDAYFMANRSSNYDISLSLSSGENFNATKVRDRDNRLTDEIKERCSLSNLTTSYSISILVNNKEIERLYGEEMKECANEGEAGDNHSIEIRMLDDASFDSYCEKSGIDAGKVRSAKNGIILLNVVEQKLNYTIKRIPVFKELSGDTFSTLKESKENRRRNATTLTAVATSSELPIGQETYPENIYSEFIAIVPEKNFKSIYQEVTKGVEGKEHTYRSMMYISAKEDEAVCKELETILADYNISSDSYGIQNIASLDQSNRQVLYAVSIFAYGFILLMSIICCANMCNTVSTSIALRRTEFAMLKSVGMTPKKFRKMIRFESLLYGIKALAYGIPISLLCSYLIYKYVVNRFTVGFMLPWYIYVAAVVLVFVVVGSAMLYSSSKVRKENIIDGLKNELN